MNAPINIMQKKERIITFLRFRGPCLPATVSREISLSLLLTSALLSEMVSDKMIKASNLKIGGSPLYFLPGQETMLENFTKNLSTREYETFQLLKKEKVLLEEDVTPADRVALKSMKDFAIPISVKHDNKEKIFFKLFSISEEETQKKIDEIISKKLEMEKSKEIQVVQPIAISTEPEIKKITEQELEKIKIRKIKKESEKEKIKMKKDTFREKVSSYINLKKLEIVKELEGKEKMFIVSSDSQIGKLNFLVIAKKKKSINENDLTLALHESQKLKMPVLLLTNGKIVKKAKNYANELENYVIIRELRE